MAKPKKKIPPAKDHQLTIRFTEDLFNVLTADAEAAGLPRAEYIRQLIANRKPVVKQEIVFNDPKILESRWNNNKSDGKRYQRMHRRNL